MDECRSPCAHNAPLSKPIHLNRRPSWISGACLRRMCCLLSFESKTILLGVNGSRPFVESKRYVRGLRRKPVSVSFPDDGTSKVKRQSAPSQMTMKLEMPIPAEDTRHKQEKALNQRIAHTAAKQPAKPADKPSTQDEVAGIRFERAFPGDKRLSRVVSVAKSRNFRENQGKILLEGRRLIIDALNAGAHPQMVFFSSMDRLLELPLDKLKRASLVKVKFGDIKLWSDLVAPQGVIAIFSRPDASKLHYNSNDSIPLSLICDNIRDPGNLGTIIRCAVAAGCSSVLLTKGCVDVWEPKVLRAAMGAHFRLPIYNNLEWGEIINHLPKSVTVHVADNSGTRLMESAEHESIEPKRPQKAGEYGWVRTQSHLKQVDYEVSDSDSEDEHSPRLDTKLYHEHWAQTSTALVIGGETYGLSVESLQLAEKTAGQRLFIPVVNDVDSLNSAMAASILLFEGRKQLMQLRQSKSQNVNRMQKIWIE